jgi:predicted aldo/keto reductase-like oxidoreductase
MQNAWRAPMSSELSRRLFLGSTLAMAAACNQGGPPKAPDSPKEGDIPLPPPATTAAEMPMRQLGKTGAKVSAIGLGGFHIGTQKDEAESLKIIRTAVDRGITFLDNCWDYNKGGSEERMGKALRDGYRQKVFLMTKLDARPGAVATQQLEQSLKRLQTDVIDLVQVHEVIRMEDPVAAFREGGCIEALIAAKKAGKIRFIGFTGHKDPDIHLAMLKAADEHKFEFDTVQMPLNVMDAHYRSFEKSVLPVLVQKGIGVLGMKSMGSGIILQSKVVTPVECLHYALSLPTSVVITGCDTMGVLNQAIEAAINFKPLPAEAMTALLDRTREAARNGDYEKFKTTHQFDGTINTPKWLTTAEV